MKKYIFYKLLYIIPVLIGITFLAFILGYFSPGDPALEALSDDGFHTPTEEEIKEKRLEMGLDDPISIQYIRWLKNVLKGDLGKTITTNEDIFEIIKTKFPITFLLTNLSLLLTIIISIPIGIISTIFKARFLEKIIKSLSVVFISIPGFSFAYFMIYIFSENLKILPVSYNGTIKSLLMPIIVLSFGVSGILIRVINSSITNELTQDYITTARSKGLKESAVIIRHAFKNSFIVVLTFLSNHYAAILGGSIIVETIFSVPGIARFIISSINSRDYNVMQAYVLLTGVIYITINLLVDISYSYINPRIKVGKYE